MEGRNADVLGLQFFLTRKFSIVSNIFYFDVSMLLFGNFRVILQMLHGPAMD